MVEGAGCELTGDDGRSRYNYNNTCGDSTAIARGDL